jgi:hypothetical protein
VESLLMNYQKKLSLQVFSLTEVKSLPNCLSLQVYQNLKWNLLTKCHISSSVLSNMYNQIVQLLGQHSLSYSHYIFTHSHNVSMRERVVQQVVKFGCTNNMSLSLSINLNDIHSQELTIKCTNKFKYTLVKDNEI